MAGTDKPRQDEVRIVNAPSFGIADAYHHLLRASWKGMIVAIVALYLATNVLFAVGYLLVGGVANMPRGSFVDAFFFSAQTLGTIGYGFMYPVSWEANLLVTAESIASVIIVALATGLVFSKFSMPTARIEFTRQVTIFKMDGTPTLAFRVANQRGNYIVEAQMRVSILRTERTKEGVLLYRMHDLRLARDRSPAMGRSWTILHPIAPDSPLFGASPEMLQQQEIEIVATVVGIDGTSMQTLHARNRWTDQDIVFDKRHVDMLSESPDGTFELDYGKFHALVDAA